MNREEKMSKMDMFCDGKHCSNCKVDKENPNHECGDGKGYSMDYNMVSNEELDMNYKMAFEEVKEENKVLNIKGKQIAVLCDTREKVNKFYGALNRKFDGAIFDCENPSKLYIGYDTSDDLTWDSKNYYQNKNYKLITFEEFIGEIKEEEKKVNKFKVGDVVVGNSNKRYGYTSKGVKCKVSKIINDNEIKVNIIDGSFDRDVEFSVNSRYFDLVKPNSPTKTITITTSDSTTTLTDGILTVSVNRYYTDKNDEEVAVSEVTDKYYEELARIEREKNTPKVGDKVRVIDDERVYSRYDDWIVENKIDIKYALLWQENYSPKNESTGFIRAIYPHLASKDIILALVETEYHAYIINIEGLKVIK